MRTHNPIHKRFRIFNGFLGILLLSLATLFPIGVKGAEKETEVPGKSFYMAVRTNMLYDVLAVPNVAAEFYLGKNLSVAPQWMYAWWSHRSRNRFWRIYGGDVTLRYWFGREARNKPLTGHHAGIYAGAFTFCFETGHRGYIGGKPGSNLWDRCMLNIGAEYGYSLPVSRRMNIDFTIGVGYIGGLVEKYSPHNGHYYWDATARRTWIGPTKAEISLVWLIGN